MGIHSWSTCGPLLKIHGSPLKIFSCVISLIISFPLYFPFAFKKKFPHQINTRFVGFVLFFLLYFLYFCILCSGRFPWWLLQPLKKNFTNIYYKNSLLVYWSLLFICILWVRSSHIMRILIRIFNFFF